jgi:hypothetical protein
VVYPGTDNTLLIYRILIEMVGDFISKSGTIFPANLLRSIQAYPTYKNGPVEQQWGCKDDFSSRNKILERSPIVSINASYHHLVKSSLDRQVHQQASTNLDQPLWTGASGFLGAQTLKELLERGFFVRIAVRSEAKADFLRSRFPNHEGHSEFVIVEDITTPGAFDEAVKGVEGIIHLASPTAESDPDLDPQALIEPAVNGTVGILKSAHKAGGVKRVIVISSGSAAWTFTRPNAVFTEVRLPNVGRLIHEYW